MIKIDPIVDNDIANEYEDFQIVAYYRNNFKNILDRKKCKWGVCYNYALKDYKIDWEDDIENKIKREYKKVNFKDIKKGDLVTYYDESIYDFPQHFAIVKKVSNNIYDVILRSKWGTLGIFEHRLHEVPEMYGTKVLFWRKTI